LLALMMRGGTPSFLACALTVVAGVAVGLLNGLLLTRLKLPHPFISTLGTMNVARGAALLLASGVPISALPARFRETVAGSACGIPSPVLVAGVLYAVGHLFLTRTVWGRDLYALGGNREAARLCGIPVDRRLNLAYALSGGAAGLAAVVMAARMNYGFPLAGLGGEMDGIDAVIGGRAGFFGGEGTDGDDVDG